MDASDIICEPEHAFVEEARELMRVAEEHDHMPWSDPAEVDAAWSELMTAWNDLQAMAPDAYTIQGKYLKFTPSYLRQIMQDMRRAASRLSYASGTPTGCIKIPNPSIKD